jgi:hypothetical protein
MNTSPQRPNSTLWVALAAIAVLATGVTLSARLWHPRGAMPATPAPRATGASGGAGESASDPPEDVIAEALRDAPVTADSAAIKSRWIDEVRAIDLAGLDPAQRDLFVRFANAERCTCGCGYTLAGCRASDMSCEVSGPRLDALLDSVRTGRLKSARGIRAKPGSGKLTGRASGG